MIEKKKKERKDWMKCDSEGEMIVTVEEWKRIGRRRSELLIERRRGYIHSFSFSLSLAC